MSKCPICQNTKISTFLKKPKFEILKCCCCQFAWLKDSKPQNQLIKLYDKDYFDDKKTEGHYLNALKKFEFIKPFLPKKAKVLDYGCGLGYFFHYAQNAGFHCFGYDVSKYCAQYIKTKYNIPVITAKPHKNLYKAGFFDCIVMFDTIEHIKDLDGLVTNLNYWLKPGGYLFITTPNLDSWDSKLFKSLDIYTKTEQHIYFFSPKSLRILLEKHGFDQSNQRIWGFVRNLDFIAGGLNWPWLRKLMNHTFLGKINFFIPLHAMMVWGRRECRI